jgi:hypothetical protein
MKSAHKVPPQREMWDEKAQPPAGMNSERVYVWNPTRPRVYCPPGFGEDPHGEINQLADAIADVAQLFNRNGELVHLSEGKLRPIDKDVLVEIIAKYVRVPQLKNSGTEDEPRWACEYAPYTPSEEVLEALLDTERAWFEGALSSRVPQVS